MSRRLTNTETVAIAVASCSLAFAALVASLQCSFAPKYSDFIVGNIAWRARTKVQDLLAVPVFVTALSLSFWLLSRLLGAIERKFGTMCSAEFVAQLFWWSTPFAIAVGGLLFSGPIEPAYPIISVFGLIALSAASGYSVWRERELSPSRTGLILVASFFVALIPLEFALILGRAPLTWIGQIDIPRYLKATYFLAIASPIAMCVWAFQAPESLARNIPKILVLAQIGLLSLILALYPSRLIEPGGAVREYPTADGLKLLLLAFIIWGVFDVLHRCRKARRAGSGEWGSLVSPVAIFALLVAVKFGVTIQPVVSPDDYHNGEQLLGWWSYLHGAIPYVNYTPAHGLIDDDLSAFLSYLFYDGTAASVPEASRIGSAALSLIAFLSIYRFTTSGCLAFASIAFLGGRLTWLFFTPFICLWFGSLTKNEPSRWLGIWLLTVPVVILGAPGQGAVLVAASAIMALDNVSRLWSESGGSRWKTLGIPAIVLVITAIATPLVPMLVGAVEYVLDNSSINQVAYGIPWEFRWKNEPRSSLTFEALRMSWIAICFACLAVIRAAFKRRVGWEAKAMPAAVVLVFVTLLIPYSMGRIDPNSMSRAGLVAILGWTVLIPIISWSLLEQSHRAAVVLVLAVMGNALNYGPPSLLSLKSAVSAWVAIGLIRDGKASGLPNVGTGVVENGSWERLSKLRALLDEQLRPDDKYLDLTNRNAQYFYLNRLPPMAVSAPYNMVPLRQQMRAVAELSRDPPQMALMEADNINHDGGSLALRSPLLFRFVMDNYDPDWKNGFVIGHRKRQNRPIASRTIRLEVKNITDDNWIKGVHRREAAIVTRETKLLTVLSEGSEVVLANGESRHIIRVWREGGAIWLDGKALNASENGAPHDIEADLGPESEHEFRLALFDKAFAVDDLAEVPVSWGRSEASLLKNMILVAKLDGVSPVVRDMVSEGGSYKIAGERPQLAFDVSGLTVSGRDAGLLRFEFGCSKSTPKPRIQVFWWGDEQTGPSDTASLRFTGENGVLIVPMDAYPRWMDLKRVQRIIVDLSGVSSCGAVSVRSLSLYQRRYFNEAS